jgi:hypothetical protein
VRPPGRISEGPAGRDPPKKQTAALPLATLDGARKSGCLGNRRDLRNLAMRRSYGFRLADYFLFAFRFFFFAAFFFDVLRAAFFAAILRTVVAFFLLFGIETTPFRV